MTDKVKAQHTPGPWLWYEGYDTINGPSDERGTLEDGRKVSFGCESGLFSEDGEPVVFGLWRNDDQADCEASSRPNARLIAAAPELLAALEATQSLLRRIKKEDYVLWQQIIDKFKGNDSPWLAVDVWDGNEAAIRKARGE